VPPWSRRPEAWILKLFWILSFGFLNFPIPFLIFSNLRMEKGGRAVNNPGFGFE
jgi:hypothetical protein